MAALAHLLDILMFVAVCILLLAGFPVAFTLAGVALIFGLLGYLAGVFSLSFFMAFPQRIFGTMINEVLLAVPLFVFMGVMLERSKVAEELLETMGRLFGTLRGGLGISVSIVGALLAASTGIVGATVVTMGLLSLPTMLRYGYSPRLATGSIAAAGTLGQIIPPSIVLVILGDQLSNAYQKAQLDMGIFSPETVSVGDLFAGALIPGLVLVGMYIVFQIVMAIMKPDSSPPMPAAEVGTVPLSKILHALLPPVVLIVAVLGSILGGIATPTEAAAVGAIGATLLAGYRLAENRPWPIYVAGLSLIGVLLLTANMDLRFARTVIPPADWAGIIVAAVLCLLVFYGLIVALVRIHRGDVLGPVMRSTTQITSMVFVILIGAALFSLVFRGLGGEEMVHSLLSQMPGGALGAMIAVMVLMFILGFFLDFLEIVFVVVPIVAPILLMMEMPDGSTMSPVWLGVMMAVNLQTSFLTPPFGFALFYLRGVAPRSVRTMDIYRGIIPFVFIQVLALIVLWYLPELATWLPTVVYGR
ncbi:tripartite ATP-independent transporter DctM subunit [Tepidamorphus gemmatus]|uniref:Tripartite ATP-independent transporter DctM subunit n=1 Tax=Tepidamorphus gemmatus TaxID=747076 RepID=A0A4R3MIU8_9HYPH|nr:TRAP transporter large permease subunit [Tepidamorphus gemmatus]TCT13243.1 tripartite ATP-independent transporter DctM subunit [Tepidamorphus gemmatus]